MPGVRGKGSKGKRRESKRRKRLTKESDRSGNVRNPRSRGLVESRGVFAARAYRGVTWVGNPVSQDRRDSSIGDAEDPAGEA